MPQVVKLKFRAKTPRSAKTQRRRTYNPDPPPSFCRPVSAVIIPFQMYIDSHAHIEGAEFDADRQAVIQRARDAGVEIIMCVGDGEVAADSHAAAFRLADEYPFIYTTVGVHPHEARLL